MKYLPIGSELFIENRIRLSKELKSNSIVVFNSNDIMPTSADGTMNFKQHSDIFHLSGIDQEQSILVLFPNAKEPKHREILFLRETNEEIAIWEGHKYTKEEATAASGIKTVLWLSEFERIFNTLMVEAEHVYLNTNEHLRAVVEVETRDARFIKWCQSKYPLHNYLRIAPIMHQIRAIKSEAEIELLQKAIDITEKGFRRVLKFLKPGVMEYEVEAEYIHEFLINRSSGFAFAPIMASGPNSCVLHYIDNNMKCKDGDLILMDVGACYANYNADMTRTVPVNGKYSQRQKDVYNAVLRVQKEAMKLLTLGNSIPEYHVQVGEIMEKELMDLGLLKMKDIEKQNPDWPAYKKYFMHGTSHHLGVDVHDYGKVTRKFEEGMVFTVEPGIYIREEGIGIRIENDVVIRKNGIEDLMKNIPAEVEEIEDLMNS